MTDSLSSQARSDDSLASQARKLAERVVDELYGECEYSGDRWTCKNCSPSLKDAERAILEGMREALEAAKKELCWWCKEGMPMDTDKVRAANGQIAHLGEASNMLHMCTAVRIESLKSELEVGKP